MTAPVTIKSQNLVIEFNVAGTWTAPCAMPSRSIKFSASTTSVDLPDCDDQDAAPWTTRDMKALSAKIDGDGRMTKANADLIRDLFLAGDLVEARVVIADTEANGGGVYSGQWALTAFELGAALRERVTIRMSADSSGPIVWTAGDHS